METESRFFVFFPPCEIFEKTREAMRRNYPRGARGTDRRLDFCAGKPFETCEQGTPRETSVGKEMKTGRSVTPASGKKWGRHFSTPPVALRDAAARAPGMG